MLSVVRNVENSRVVARQTGPVGLCRAPRSFWSILAGRCLLGAFLLFSCATLAHGAELSLKETEAARKLYIAKCAKCHKFYDPARYSDQEWRKWMVKMSRKARLKPQQQEMLSRYIDQNLRAPAHVKKETQENKELLKELQN